MASLSFQELFPYLNNKIAKRLTEIIKLKLTAFYGLPEHKLTLYLQYLLIHLDFVVSIIE
jgi:hypothetical protein